MCRIDDDAQASWFGQISGTSERVDELRSFVADHEHFEFTFLGGGRPCLTAHLPGLWRRSVATESVQPSPVLSCRVVPSLPVGVVDGHGHQRDRSHGTHLGLAEFADRPDPLHHTFDGRVVGNRRPSTVGIPPVEAGL